jgi:hypothetical protein
MSVSDHAFVCYRKHKSLKGVLLPSESFDAAGDLKENVSRSVLWIGNAAYAQEASHRTSDLAVDRSPGPVTAQFGGL